MSNAVVYPEENIFFFQFTFIHVRISKTDHTQSSLIQKINLFHVRISKTDHTQSSLIQKINLFYF